jgi:hypothetical protein
MPLYDMVCNGCKREWVRYSSITDRTKPCEECNGEVEQVFKPSNRGVVGDEIPGGVLIRHGLCDEETGEPIRYYYKSDIAKEAARRGLVNHVKHVPDSRGSDKSKHTVRWTSVPILEEERLKAWHAHEERLKNELS